MLYLLQLIFRSVLVVAVGITGFGIFGFVISPNSSPASLVFIPVILFYGLYLYGIPSILGMMPLLWMQDNRSLGEDKLFNVFVSCLYGFVIGFLAASIWPQLSWQRPPSFEWNLGLMGGLGGGIGGLYAGIRFVKKPKPRAPSRVSWAD